MQRVTRGGLEVAEVLADFVEEEALPGTGIDAADYWDAFGRDRARPRAAERARCWPSATGCRRQIDDWHRGERGAVGHGDAYRAFLREIGYLVPEGPDFAVETAGVDPEIATISGPQLVVPVIERALRAERRQRALGVALRRALRHRRHPRGRGPRAGPALQPAARGGGDRLGAGLPRRGGAAGARRLGGRRGASRWRTGRWRSTLADGARTGLAGRGSSRAISATRRRRGSSCSRTTGSDRGADRRAPPPSGGRIRRSISDVWLEAAITTIMDCEDSVAAVDAEDKVVVYRNWLGLMQGDLAAEVEKGGRTLHAAAEPGRESTSRRTAARCRCGRGR